MRLLFGVTSHSSDQKALCAASLKRSYSGPGSTRTGSAHAAPDAWRPRRTGSSMSTNLHHAGDFTPNAGASGLKARGRAAGVPAATARAVVVPTAPAAPPPPV